MRPESFNQLVSNDTMLVYDVLGKNCRDKSKVRGQEGRAGVWVGGNYDGSVFI